MIQAPSLGSAKRPYLIISVTKFYIILTSYIMSVLLATLKYQTCLKNFTVLSDMNFLIYFCSIKPIFNLS